MRAEIALAKELSQGPIALSFRIHRPRKRELEVIQKPIVMLQNPIRKTKRDADALAT